MAHWLCTAKRRLHSEQYEHKKYINLFHTATMHSNDRNKGGTNTKAFSTILYSVPHASTNFLKMRSSLQLLSGS